MAVAKPPRVSGSKVSYEEQCKLFKWVQKKMNSEKLPEAFLPSEKNMDSWDKHNSKQISQLSRDLLRQRQLVGEKPAGARALLAEVWGFPGRRGNKSKAGYTVQQLRQNVLACNKDYYQEVAAKQRCDKVDLEEVILFSVIYAMEWNRRTHNINAVLANAFSHVGPGLRGVAEQTGMLIGSLKKGKLQLDIWQPGQGPWSEQLKRRLDALITRYQLPHRELPSYSVIQKLDGSLANAISCYKRDERAAINALRNTWMTGQQLWAQDVGYHLSATRQYPNGHWQVIDVRS